MTIDEMKKIRESRGYSFAQLSEYSGVPVVTLQKIFSGKTQNPRKATLDAIERVLSGDEEVFRGKAYEYGSSGIHEEGSLRNFREAEPVYGRERIYFSIGEHTVDEYRSLPPDRRVELIDGFFYDMAAPKTVHQDIAGYVYRKLCYFIEKNKGKCKAYISPIDVQLDRDDKTMIQPDVIIVCDKDKIKDFGIFGAPDFVLEVVSESSKKMDRLIKLEKYGNAGVREYWILDPNKRIVIRYHFEDEEFIPEVIPLVGSLDVAIYGGKLKISLDAISEIIDEYGNG